jgi:Na+-transporting methylmalonyl-CoA/oxaloacetate decarboxylase gamma subunit
MSNIQTGLLITAIGMGLVFAMIALLWGLMVILVKLTSRNTEPEVEKLTGQTNLPAISGPLKAKREAAAAAVAVALAHRASQQKKQTQTGEINIWQATARLKQLQNQMRRGQRG